MLRDLWHQLTEVARALDIAVSGPEGPGPYDPEVYRRVYEALLRHRHVEVVPLRTVLPTTGLSVYDVAVPHHEVTPREAEADAIVREAETRYPDANALARDVDRWWMV